MPRALLSFSFSSDLKKTSSVVRKTATGLASGALSDSSLFLTSPQRREMPQKQPAVPSAADFLRMVPA